MKKIGLAALFGALILILLNTSSCKKDKTPVIDENCTDTISFSQQIQPMMDNYCISCHQSQAPVFTDHTSISANASAILNSLRGTTQLMPLGGPALDDSLINQFNCWLSQGRLNN